MWFVIPDDIADSKSVGKIHKKNISTIKMTRLLIIDFVRIGKYCKHSIHKLSINK